MNKSLKVSLMIVLVLIICFGLWFFTQDYQYKKEVEKYSSEENSKYVGLNKEELFDLLKKEDKLVNKLNIESANWDKIQLKCLEDHYKNNEVIKVGFCLYKFNFDSNQKVSNTIITPLP